MHTDAFGNFILLSWPKLRSWAKLGEKKLLIKLKSHLTVLGRGLVDLLSCMSCVLTHIPLHSLTSHLSGPLLWNCLRMHCYNMTRKKKGEKAKKTTSSRSTAVTSGSSWQHRQSLVCLSGPCQAEALVLFSSAKEKSALPQDLSFYGDGRRLREKTQLRKCSRESSGEIWSPVCWGRCATRGRSLFRASLNQICSRCLKDFDLRLKHSP